jgi:hypothetical protein
MTRRALALAGAALAAAGLVLASTATADPSHRPAGVSSAAVDRVSLTARPTTIAGMQPALLFGAVSSGRENEEVTIQARDCGTSAWTGAVGLLTHAGGTFNTVFNRGVTTTIRAQWKDVFSSPITIRHRVRIEFHRLGSGKFTASAVGRASLWRRTMQIQRRQGGNWRLLRTVRLTDSWAAPGSPYVWNTAEFALKVPRRTLLRAVLPQAQARPCYLTGVSRTLTT